MAKNFIKVRGAKQNNLKNLSLELPLNELIVVTGVSGSGKSSLAFDTIYAEGQRRYVETFSPYARQFLDRMDKPQVDHIDGVPPAIAIDQVNPIRTSRSTVGTMTELNDHLKLLFAKAAQLYCQGCGRQVQKDTPEIVYNQLLTLNSSPDHKTRILITFKVDISEYSSPEEIKTQLLKQGYTRIHSQTEHTLEVIQDRVLLNTIQHSRILESLEVAFKHGQGHIAVYPLDEKKQPLSPWHFSTYLHCPHCNLSYQEPSSNQFSFNSPLGACETCRGFGRTIGVDYDLVIPDQKKTLAEGAIKPWQTKSYEECQEDLIRFASQKNIPTDIPWKGLTRDQQDWVLKGDGAWEDNQWYGVHSFFSWLESKSYKMHIRVLLAKYRTYHICPDCQGARLKSEALLWRLGTRANADEVLNKSQRFKPYQVILSLSEWQVLPGLTIHDVLSLPIDRCLQFFQNLHLSNSLDEALELLLTEIRSRLSYLVEVGVGYLSLDRQSRTLSGGEVQRINLTTALGTSLVNTLFVLDEPSIGLHPRDTNRIIRILKRLRDSGNSLLVVEHDEQIMKAANRILDLGPGPGEHGGEKVFFGTPNQLIEAKTSLTGDYLAGRKKITSLSSDSKRTEAIHGLKIIGAKANNLKSIDVTFPLNRLVCITGVSGSGKSTLIQDVLYQGWRTLQGKSGDALRNCRSIIGYEFFQELILVDQSAVGKTTRSNPVSYVGALDSLRKIFSLEPLAQQRGYSPTTFSFNSGTGRCPTCNGSGFEHVEMQFLSDVYIRCPECNGQRFRSEVLEVTLSSATGDKSKSIAGILDLTVTEAMDFFIHYPSVLEKIKPLQTVGLGYIKLGQPLPTLSGGESQRLKLAGYLAKAQNHKKDSRSILFLLDEPTTGLHFDDIATLIGVFQQLLAEGYSLIVIEHNLDVIQAADWLIDLGPEGGDQGGEIIFTGTPAEIIYEQNNHTGTALKQYQQESIALAKVAEPVITYSPDPDVKKKQQSTFIHIHHAYECNLKGIDVDIPRDKLTVITGVSGSGKSTLAFDILFAEGQRRYLESLNAYARQFVQPAPRPNVDVIYGIPPTVAIEQRTSRGGIKSTVATLTEIYHFLRLLFVKLGKQYCPDCQTPIESQNLLTIKNQILKNYQDQTITLLAPLITARKGYYTDLAKWATTKGFTHLQVDEILTSTENWPRLDRFKEHTIQLPIGSIIVNNRNEAQLTTLLKQTLSIGQGIVKICLTAQLEQLSVIESKYTTYSINRSCPSCHRSFNELDPRLFSYNSKHGYCPHCQGSGLEGLYLDKAQLEKEFHDVISICSKCYGQRLNSEALSVRFRDKNIVEITKLSVTEAEIFFQTIKLSGREATIAQDILPEIKARLAFLNQVGLTYLTLDRSAPTLSGGEAQRIRLAAQLGSSLQGVCYILDEPTIGLHPRDNKMLLNTLNQLKRKGNTVVMVEHDETAIRRADYIIDLGPKGGINGGQIIVAGNLNTLLAHKESLTAHYLNHSVKNIIQKKQRSISHWLKIRGANLHNLKNIDIDFPLECLVGVTGVSGSGKSTLVRQILYKNLQKRLQSKEKNKHTDPAFYGCHYIQGWESVNQVIEVDQTPIGKTPRSCLATYIGFWDDIRYLFSETPEAKIRGYSPSRFSFNIKEGRCQECDGQGIKKIEMSFLPDVIIPCERCHGDRFVSETLAVRYKDKNIGEILKMNVDEATSFFAAHPKIYPPLALLQKIGLGYLELGQASPTLSGGEAQRIKLVSELAKRNPKINKHILYILDEPTIGLHMADVAKLIEVLHQLIDSGNTVIIIEHNLDVIAEADWVIDLGPKGGDKGGNITAYGTPEDIVSSASRSYTAQFLAKHL
ncbi:excinuclease ABC subunit UvrA [Candidatus Nitrosacidococcus tergens]|uniref:UvrABC system protein A n=1 Tax=Candidatus Nitrosacidococcus tergens TaxID=553981 RepID=A0A7G1Q7M4_9GAMM|nr:excinuclease ABC subunit UvrA [Candidatus Nitrosacidococcus tergens]CAB1274618.1 Excinuclease ABC, A subunit [Candidatus Nitrosacidococcus tergens]